MNDSFAIVIPALDPGDTLPKFVAALREACDVPILLVDDGSRAERRPVFRQCVEQVPGVSLVVHETNKGKGRALKTAFKTLLDTRPGLQGCVTCDSDGQHAPEDVAKCLAALKASPDALVLGCRTFCFSQDIPWKSRLGNQSMRMLFRLVAGRDFLDTQTGLRAIPADFMRELLTCQGERFEFETHMLLQLSRRTIIQIPIRTLYVEGNRETHFNPLADSAKIMTIILGEVVKKLAWFAGASLLSFGLDIGLFTLLYHYLLKAEVPGRLFLAVLIARIISVVFNYTCNRYFVFGEVRSDRRFDGATFSRYALLAICIMGASYALTRLGHALFSNASLTGVKACVDACLFLASYSVQRLYIFRHRDPSPSVAPAPDSSATS